MVTRGESDSSGDRRNVSLSLVVEHADWHDARAVSQAGEAVAVVGGLGDRAGNKGPVTVSVVGEGVVGDEVIAGDELKAREVR